MRRYTRLRYVVPKELVNGRDPTDGFVLQDSSSTNVLANSDFSKTSITQAIMDLIVIQIHFNGNF